MTLENLAEIVFGGSMSDPAKGFLQSDGGDGR